MKQIVQQLSYNITSHFFPPPRFDPSNDKHILEVNHGDTVEIICPYYPSGWGVDQQDWEYYYVYYVSEIFPLICSIIWST